ncbi:hypothetical protein FLK61_29455 [Paenalkalicoccus suaedae]|uniref:Uncharacterized protein n=1 Tax=Paenalkalicoccus suaedae TaxID=2592382 RepID=A0A859FF46_9BACI|nr:hypothetical protein [Paenalkalicoccus suaedae]QKS70856.1 hypothetical protein FLK61_29455 [Paenalkalicoccus suaedae]
MEGLIELVLGNPFILFLIIAFLFSTFRKRGTADEARQQPDLSPDETATIDSEERNPSEAEQADWRDIFYPPEERSKKEQPAPSKSSSESKEATASLSKANDELQRRYEQVQQRKSEAAKQDNIMDSPIYKKDLSASKSKIDLDFKNITKEDAIKGVIWSEVLGKPKARRHR